MKGMSVEQANYCDNLKAGNVEVWQVGCLALDLVDEYDFHDFSKRPINSFFELMENEEVTIRVADQGLLKSIGFKFETANPNWCLLNTALEIDDVFFDSGVMLDFGQAIENEIAATDVVKSALQKLSSN